MSTNNNNFVSYGFSQPLINDAPVPITAQRPPTTNDRAQLGTIWLDQPNDAAYVLVSIINNSSMWIALGGAGGSLTFDADAGSAVPSGNVIDIAGGSNINTGAGTNVVTVNLDDTVSISGSFTAGTTLGDITVDNGNINLPDTNAGGTNGAITFGGGIFIHNYPGIASENFFMGPQAGNTTNTATQNLAAGYQSLNSLTNGGANSTYGWRSGLSITTSFSNSGFGESTLKALTAGNGFNTAIGAGALSSITTGSFNTALGLNAAAGYNDTESSNVCIANDGEDEDNHVIRIGTDGSGDGEHNKCYIAGIIGNTVANTEIVTIDSATGQLGVTSASSGGFIWSTVTGATPLVAGHGYIVNGASKVIFTFPVSAAVGDTFTIRVLDTAVGGWQINQNANQYIISNSDGGDPASLSTVGITGNVSTDNTSPFIGALLICVITDVAFSLIDYSGNTLVLT